MEASIDSTQFCLTFGRSLVISRVSKVRIHYVKTIWNHSNSTFSKCYLLQEGVKVKRPAKVTFVVEEISGREKDATILNVPPVSNRSVVGIVFIRNK